ncbi:MAG: M48 family metalloprotease [Syntrophobacteraceae bacterium]
MRGFLARPAGKCLALWVVGVYALLSVLGWPAPQNLHAFTLSEEQALGRKVLDQVREHYNLIEDGEVISYIQAVGKRVSAQLGTTPYDFQFFVIDDPTLNAFAVPGGYVFIYRGLIEIMGNEGELASIIGHELGHIEAHHMEQRISKGRVLNIATIAAVLAGALLGGGGEGSQALIASAMAGSQSLQLQYSRENENEADQLGFRSLCAAGYDPTSMLTMMQRLQHSRWSNISRSNDYLSTHPATTERIQNIDSLIQAHSKDAVHKQPVGDFAMMQAALLSDYTDKAVALERFDSWAKEEGKAAAAAYGKGRVYLRFGEPALAVPLLQEAARLKPDSPMILSALGYAYFQNGLVAQAQRTFQTALLLDPNAAIVHYRLGLVLKDQGNGADALKQFQLAEPLAASLPEIDYQMGVVLGQTDQIGLAHYYLGRYYKHQRDIQTAMFHFNKAKALLADSPDKLKEVEEALKEMKGGDKVKWQSPFEKRIR